MNLQVASFYRCECSPVYELLYCTTLLFRVLYCKIKKFFCVCFLCIICVKSTINLLQYSTIWLIVLAAYLGSLYWTYEPALGTEIIHMQGTYCIQLLCC